MQEGAAYHADGRPELALVLFEQALQQAPESTDAVSACATVLSELDRPHAAYRLLLQSENILMANADGATNLAITAESCNENTKARQAYECALSIEPHHLRAMNNLGLLSAAEGRLDEAVAWANKCAANHPADVIHKVNLADYLTAMGHYGEALETLKKAQYQSPERMDIRIRQALVTAFNAQLTRSRNILVGLTADAQMLLKEYLARLQPDPYCPAESGVAGLACPSAFEIYALQAYARLRQCDWHCNGPLTAMLESMATSDLPNEEPLQSRHALAASFYALFLDMGDAAQLRLQQIFNAQTQLPAPAQQPFTVYCQQTKTVGDTRLHVGLAIQTLQDCHEVRGLLAQLHMHNTSRLVMHVYASTPPALASVDLMVNFQNAGVQVCELAHMTDLEALGRIRLDNLDVYVDMTAHTSCHRRFIATARVARIQVLGRAWHRHHLPAPYDYTLSDTWLHPEAEATLLNGAIVRLGGTCWLAAPPLPARTTPLTRDAVGLPYNCLVLCCWTDSLHIDPATFAAWMKILRSLPDAVLFLPGQSGSSAANLARESQQAGVRPERLIFTPAPSAALINEALAMADLFLDTLRVNSCAELVCALQAGVPALTCSGATVTSRMGGSIMRAAGLASCVLENPDTYIAEAIRLGRDTQALQKLRQRIGETRRSPLFDTAAHTRNFETALETMVRRAQSGLKPITFDAIDGTLIQSPTA